METRPAKSIEEPRGSAGNLVVVPVMEVEVGLYEVEVLGEWGSDGTGSDMDPDLGGGSGRYDAI